MTTIQKEIVQKCFCRNKGTYNKAAIVQKDVSLKLIHKMNRINNIHYNKVLEIGCGTGFLTKWMWEKFRPEQYFINDLEGSMHLEIDAIAKYYGVENYDFIPGDAEALSFPDELDLVVSTSTFQWFQHMDRFFYNISRVIKRDGYIAFSTFGKSNFQEIKETLGIGLDYLTVKELENMLSPDFSLVEVEEWKQILQFISPVEVLRHIKLTGVNGIGTKFIGKKQLSDYDKTYRKHYMTAEGTVSLTYHPIMIIAKKK